MKYFLLESRGCWPSRSYLNFRSLAIHVALCDWHDLREFVVATSSSVSTVCDYASEHRFDDAFANIGDRSN